MKKSLIALAVAGAFAAPAFAATSNVDVYGYMSFSVDWADTNNKNGADGSDMVTGVDNISRIGFKGSEDLGGGLKAVWQIESQLNADDTGINTLRNTFVGVAGGFGTVLMGRHDTPYKLGTGRLDPFADTIGDYNAIIGASTTTGASSLFDLRAPQTVAYITPTFSGFHAAIAYVELKNVEAAGVDNVDAWSVTGIYDNGPLFASLSYENHAGGVFGSSAGVGVNDEISAWKLGLGYTFGDTKLGLVYEDISGGDTNGATAGGKPNERDAWYLSVSHAMGPIVLKAAYGTADDSKRAATNNDGADFWAVGMDYNLSKRTSLYASYAKVEVDSERAIGDTAAFGYSLGGGQGYSPAAATGALSSAKEASAFSIGIKHSF